MKTCITFLLLLAIVINSQAQDLYFPPLELTEWETYSFEDLSWCEDAYELAATDLEALDTKAFIVLKDGKIVIEEYFNDFKQDSSSVWFSGAKSLMSFLTGIAQSENLLSINEPSHKYLGQGWSSLTPEQEDAINISHHLKMTTGLDFNVEDNNCTDPSCLQYLNEPDTHWYYHNGAYTKTGDILRAATGLTLNAYTRNKLHNTIGMDGFWLSTEDLNLYFSTARSMARFGLLMLNNGDWDGNSILSDKDYFSQMIKPSQDLNPAYGYLWWLNGQSQIKIPGSDIVFQGKLDENAPDDMYWAIGLQGQILGVIPSQNIVVVRMGGNNNGAIDEYSITRKLTEYLLSIACDITDNVEENLIQNISVAPNPVTNNELIIQGLSNGNYSYTIVNTLGQNVATGKITNGRIENFSGDDGQYFLLIYKNNKLIATQNFINISSRQ